MLATLLPRKPRLPGQQQQRCRELQHHRHSQLCLRHRMLRPPRMSAALRPDDAGSGGSGSGSDGAADAARPPGSLADQWRRLQAGAGAPPAASGDGSTTDEAPAAAASIAERLARLARGGSSLLVEGASPGASQQAATSAEADAETATAAAAAVEADTSATVEGDTAAASETVVEAVVVEAQASDVWRFAQQSVSADAGRESVQGSASKPAADGADAPATTTTTTNDAAAAKDDDGDGGGAGTSTLRPEMVPVTSLAALAVGAVMLAQWWPVLPDVWWGLTAGGQARETLWQLATAYPDTPATRCLRFDVTAVAYDREWWRVLTAAVTHSGVVPALIALDGLRDAGKWLELAGGRMQLLAVLAVAAVGAACGYVAAPSASTCLTGPGLMVGAYTAWATFALARTRGAIPVTSDRGLVYCALQALLAANQPAVGLGSLAGGAAGGVVGALAAPLLARAAFFAVALPVTGCLAAARMAWETVKLVLAIVMAFVVATWRAAAEAVKAVRGL